MGSFKGPLPLRVPFKDPFMGTDDVPWWIILRPRPWGLIRALLTLSLNIPFSVAGWGF